MINSIFNNRLRQVLLIGLILLLTIVFINQLFIFFPGFLGAITLYILSRNAYHRLCIDKKWNKSVTALLFILSSLVLVAIPVYLTVSLVSPKINSLIGKQHEIFKGLQIISNKIEAYSGIELLSSKNTEALAEKVSAFIPDLLNSTATILTNLIMLFFLLYYLLVNGKAIEKYLSTIIPLKPENVDILAHETTLMIRANAIGIPVICIVQGIFAAIGYLIFGVSDWGLWGFMTGVFAFFPILGTMVIWAPLAIFVYSSGQSYQGIGLIIYSFVVTGNVDYITRLGLLKKMGNVHPLITVLGVIVGLRLFGFMGLIFGPLLISYFIILVKIYINEFTIPVNSIDNSA